jgi:hypothetical protein
MPSSSKKQHNFMLAIAKSPAFAKKVGIPQSVGSDFKQADKGRKFAKGGETMATKMNPGFMAMMPKKKDDKPDALAKHAAKPASKAHAGLKAGGMAKMMEGGPAKKMMMGGPAKKMAKGGFASSADGVASKGKTKATQVKMNRGGKC